MLAWQKNVLYLVPFASCWFSDCKFNCHKKCSPQVHRDCQGDVKWVPGGKIISLCYLVCLAVMLRILGCDTYQVPLSIVVQTLTLTVLVATIDAQWEGMGDVGSARYEPALLSPCPTIRVLSYSN